MDIVVARGKSWTRVGRGTGAEIGEIFGGSKMAGISRHSAPPPPDKRRHGQGKYPAARTDDRCRANPLQNIPASPSLQTVEQLILTEKRGNCIPVFVQFPADLITPCMAYLKIAKDSRYSFLLESVVAGENIARYSFVGAGGWHAYSLL
jgi:hypothetical protein